MFISFASPASGNQATTMALGEEGGSGFPNQPPTMTTMALGEEGGSVGSPPNATTYALGEEGGGISPPGNVTTMALGEEGGGITPPSNITTMAMGEEGGGGSYPRPPQQNPPCGGTNPNLPNSDSQQMAFQLMQQMMQMLLTLLQFFGASQQSGGQYSTCGQATQPQNHQAFPQPGYANLPYNYQYQA